MCKRVERGRLLNGGPFSCREAPSASLQLALHITGAQAIISTAFCRATPTARARSPQPGGRHGGKAAATEPWPLWPDAVGSGGVQGGAQVHLALAHPGHAHLAPDHARPTAAAHRLCCQDKAQGCWPQSSHHLGQQSAQIDTGAALQHVMRSKLDMSANICMNAACT